MKIRNVLGAVLMVAGIAVVGATAHAAPAILAEEKQATQSVQAEQTIDSSVFIAADVVRVDGVVNGDVFCAGSSVTIVGTVNGDVLCASSSLIVDGDIKGNLRALASTVTINGTVEGNATVGASDIVVASTGEVSGDLLGGVSSLTIDGTVGRDVIIAAETTSISGSVERDISAATNTLTITESARVGGNVEYTSDRRATIDGTIEGETRFTPSEQGSYNYDFGWLRAAAILVFLLMIGLTVFLGALIAPRAVHTLGDVSWANFGIAAVVGVTTVVMTPLFLFVLFTSGMGAWLGYILLLFWLLLLAIAPVWFGYFVGTRLVGSRTNNILLRATAGALALMVALLIPIINIFVFVVMLFVGVGLPLLGVPKLFSANPYNATPPVKKTTKKKAAA